MPAFNVYVPDELKSMMDDTKGVNWSAVAQDAFRRAIEIEGIKTVDVNQSKLARMRASRVAHRQRREADGARVRRR